MTQQWMDWNPSDMIDTADAEALGWLTVLGIGESRELSSLPYFPAFTAYRTHVDGCAVCRAPGLTGCSGGEALYGLVRTDTDIQLVELAPQN